MAYINNVPPKVLVVGHGFMGKNHCQKVAFLHSQGKAELVYVVDSKAERLTNLNVPCGTNLEDAFAKTLPDIVAICTNTQSHAQLFKQTAELAKKYGTVTHILMEKPLAGSVAEAEPLQETCTKIQGFISGGYLFRQSPTIRAGIEYLKEHHLAISSIKNVWQKDRELKGPPRPTAGVHIDEATHPLDLVINCLLPEAGIQVDGITILESSYKRQSEVGKIVDEKMQEELYGKNSDPVAEVNYKLDVNGISVYGFASYKKDPQKREITLECVDGTTLFFEFDLDKIGDRLTLHTPGQTQIVLCEEKPDKLLLGWEAFLDYIQTGKASYRIQTYPEMLFDLRLTEALVNPAPTTIRK